MNLLYLTSMHLPSSQPVQPAPAPTPTALLPLLAGTYKIPTANDIPIDFQVTLLRNSACAFTPKVHSSKAVGEPPLFLGSTVFWALKVGKRSALSLPRPSTP